MSRVDSPLPLRIPTSLEEQLFRFRHRVWLAKMVEAVAAAIASVAVAYLAVFLLDRIWDTPPVVRAGVTLAAIAGCLIIPYYLHRWVWRHRQLPQLARLLSRKLPRVGDQLLGVIELADSETEQHRSRRLCQAAIEQVAEDARHRDLCEALPNSRERSNGMLAAVTVGIGLLLWALLPAAAENAWARFVTPWREVPRYTFAAVEPLSAELVVAHGEPFEFAPQLRSSTAWKPATARVQIGRQQPLTAQLEGQSYHFEAPAQLTDEEMTVTIGDWSGEIRLVPKLRPELTSITASIELPEYLGRSEPVKQDVRGGGISLVKGSAATFTAQASRNLSSATINGQPASPEKDSVTTEAVAVDAPQELTIGWVDEYGLAGHDPLVLSISADDDALPTLTCTDLPRKKVVLDSEQLVFKVAARDDFGVREVGMEWKGVRPDLVEKAAEGERLLAAGGAEERSLDLQGTFTATSLGIEPQPIELRIFTTDYYPDRERIYSPSYLLYVLSPDQHAIWITEQLARWHRQSLEVRDRELQLYETNKQLRAMSAAELDSPQTRRKIESQAKAEQANGRRLANLTDAGKELLRTAARNPEIGVGHLDRWAEMLKILGDISANRMPSVADLLKEGAEARSVASKSPSKTAPSVGETRAQGSGNPSETKPEEKPAPAVPSIADMESSQQPAEPVAQQEPQKKNPSSPSLRLPTTTLLGKASNEPPPPAGEKIDQAVKEQQDLLAEFEKVANELNEILGNLEGSTLVKRLKAQARNQYRIAGRITDQIQGVFVEESFTTADEVDEQFTDLAVQEDQSSYTVSLIMDDMQAYFERRRLVKFKTVLDEMRKEDVLGSLRRLSEEIGAEPGISIAQCEYWSDVMDRWAEDLVDPSRSGQCPGCRSKGSLPPSIILEVMQILEGEINLREETRVAEQAQPTLDAAKHQEESQRLADVQDKLDERIVKLAERILELPDAEAEFGYELKLLDQVDQVMQEATGILASTNTGAPAIAVETEVIELLLQSKRINPGGGGGGGANPGGGGEGDTQDLALALQGPGLNQDEVREAPDTTQAVGQSGEEIPEEFRAGLDEYFNQLENSAAGG